MDLKLSGKIAMVAASSKGLGFGVAQALAREGASVSMASRSFEDITNAANLVHKETGANVKGYVFDAIDGSSIGKWTGDTISDFGGVDCLLVNAGGPSAGGFDEFDDNHWQKAFELTLLSTVRMIRSVLPSMRKRGGGSILTITSSSIKEPIDNLLLSNVMRSGVTSLAKSLARELAKDHIRVNNIVPGRFDTDRVRSLDAIGATKSGLTLEEQRSRNEKQIPWGRYGTTEEFGKAAAFLLSDSASYITGETLVIDGGAMKTVW